MTSKLATSPDVRSEHVSSEQPFYISATGPAHRPRKALKHDNAFVVLDSHGDIGAVAGGPDGLFNSDTRYLSHLELLINGGQPLSLGSSIRDDNLHMSVDLTNPDIYLDNVLVLPKDSIHISRTIFLRNGVLRERLAVTNHSGGDVEFSISLSFASDFADIFEVRGVRRDRHGKSTKKLLDSSDVVLSNAGLDGKLRTMTLSFEPKPTRCVSTMATYQLRLVAKEQRTIFVSASCRSTEAAPIAPTAPYFKELMDADRARRRSMAGVTAVETTSGWLTDVINRSMSDFYMLVSQTEQGPYPYAGIPWFSTTFGRDGIIAAMQMLWLDPAIARGVLRRLAVHQAADRDPARDSQPGKILHEMRGGEMAALGEVPFGLYYGSVDSTPLFVMLAGLYVERTGDTQLLSELWPNIERAIEWMNKWGDADGDGFIEYQRATEKGLSNQGWKDSFDSIFHADGRLADGAIALVEVQAYAYAAKALAARCAQRLGKLDRARQLHSEAETLRGRFEAAFWSDDLGTYVLALDGEKRPCQVVSSNAGHALLAGIASPIRARQVADTMLRPNLNSGWGIRTIAQSAARFNPMSYHNGSVWPHDNALIVMGLARYGFKNEIGPIFEGMCRAAACMDHRRLPELFCGFERKKGRGPTLYPVACSPQAWASGAPFMMLQALLGIEFDPMASEIRLHNPVVPSWIGEITIRGLQLRDATVDFAVRRDDDATSLRVIKTKGAVQVNLVLDTPNGPCGMAALEGWHAK